MGLMERSLWTALGVAMVVIMFAGSLMLLRGGSTPIPVAKAVERFRSDTPRSEAPATESPSSALEAPTSRSSSASTAARVAPSPTNPSANDFGRPLPAEGVYVYSTTGGDDVDVLGGSKHTYPERTTITVRRTECGFVERWDALAERWDERESCRVLDGDALKRVTSFHEFYGRSDERTLRCDGLNYPKGAKPGDAWSMTCASDVTKTLIKLKALAWEEVDVAGAAVKTLHVRVENEITGDQQGRGVRDVWGAVDTGILVRERSEMTSFSNQPFFGRTRYHEKFDIRLASLNPQT